MGFQRSLVQIERISKILPISAISSHFDHRVEIYSSVCPASTQNIPKISNVEICLGNSRPKPLVLFERCRKRISHGLKPSGQPSEQNQDNSYGRDSR